MHKFCVHLSAWLMFVFIHENTSYTCVRIRSDLDIKRGRVGESERERERERATGNVLQVAYGIMASTQPECCKE